MEHICAILRHPSLLAGLRPRQGRIDRQIWAKKGARRLAVAILTAIRQTIRSASNAGYRRIGSAAPATRVTAGPVATAPTVPNNPPSASDHPSVTVDDDGVGLTPEQTTARDLRACGPIRPYPAAAGRSVAGCYVGGEDLDRWMVEEGWALAFRKYSLDYVDAEDEARQARRGVWAGEFETPWEWRTAHRRR
jgi:Staphylococcal nuclease homologue